jgi:hypothetical protein
MTESKKALIRVYAAMVLCFFYIVIPTVVAMGDGYGARLFNFSFLLILLVPPYRYAFRRAVGWLRGGSIKR